MTAQDAACRLEVLCRLLRRSLGTPPALELALVHLHEIHELLPDAAAEVCLLASAADFSQKRIAVLLGVPERTLQGLAREARGQA